VLGWTAFQSLSQPAFIRRWMSGDWPSAAGCGVLAGNLFFMFFSFRRAGGVVPLASNCRGVSKMEQGRPSRFPMFARVPWSFRLSKMLSKMRA